MKKASYRVLQWTMLMGTAAIMATACVVTSGDGDDDFTNGGEGGTSSTAGKTSTEAGEGGTSTAGKTSGGTSSSGTSAGGSAAAGAGGAGGAGGSGEPAYVPGVCQGGDEPTSLPACTLTANDEGEPCTQCLKSRCCTEWKTCYGDTPTNACGWGKTEEAVGQFDCIQHCYLDGLSQATDLVELQVECADQCLNQCEDGAEDMGYITDTTQDVLICANENCLDECFPAE